MGKKEEAMNILNKNQHKDDVMGKCMRKVEEEERVVLKIIISKENRIKLEDTKAYKYFTWMGIKLKRINEKKCQETQNSFKNNNFDNKCFAQESNMRNFYGRI